MTEHEAQAELMILRGLADSGNDLALVRERIDRLYWEVCRKHLRHCRCKNVERDALVEIYAKLRFNTKTNTKMAKAKLVNGVVIRVGVFYVPSQGCTFAQMGAERKNAISHRANALQKLCQMLEDTL